MNRLLPGRTARIVFALSLGAAALGILRSSARAQAQPSAPPADAAPAPAGNAENGARIFKAYGCYECHGYAAQGGGGPRLGPSPIPFTAFSRYLRQPRGQMPPYTSNVVSDAELADLYAFLKTVPKSPDPKSIPLLNE